MNRKFIYTLLISVAALSAVYFTYFSVSVPVPVAAPENTKDSKSIEALNMWRQASFNRETSQFDFTDTIVQADDIIARYANKNATGEDSVSEDVYVRAKITKAIALQQGNLNLASDDTHRNFIKSYHEMMDVFTDKTMAGFNRTAVLSQMIVGIQQSNKYDWFLEAAETYKDGSFMKLYAPEVFTITPKTVWRENRSLSAYMLPVSTKPLSEEDAIVETARFQVLSSIHAMVKDIGVTPDSYLVAWDMAYLVHSLDRADLDDTAREKIIAEIAENYPFLERSTGLFRPTRYHALVLTGYIAALNYSLSEYLPNTYHFNVDTNLESIESAIARADGATVSGDSEIMAKRNSKGILAMYYVFLAHVKNIGAEHASEILATHLTPETFFHESRSTYSYGNSQDTLRNFVYEYVQSKKAASSTLDSLEWLVTK